MHAHPQVVGLSVELWLVLCCFLTVWPLAPFAPFVFSMVNVAVVVIVNSKVRRTAKSREPACSATVMMARTLEKRRSFFSFSAQLIHVIRFASRGGTAKRLENDIFWFKKPSLLLHPVKMVSVPSRTDESQARSCKQL